MLGSLQIAGGRYRKKLIEAAELWAGGLFVSEEEYEAGRQRRAKSAAALNVQLPDDEPDDATFWLWPDNVRVWHAFLGCSSQWRASMGGREGLDYSGVEVVLRRSGLRPRKRQEAWSLIQAMEFACLRVWRSD